MDIFFITLSTFAFISGIVWMIISAGVLSTLSSRIIPLLTETKDNIQDLGDLSANTVGRAVDTMDLIERRVSQTMGQAAEGGASVTKQALGVGTALAGVYMASRVITVLREQYRAKEKKSRRRKR